MALIRSHNGVYSTIPGMEQPLPVSGMSSSSLPSTFMGNAYLGNEADAQYRVTSPLTDYGKSSNQYTGDTATFGMLASFYGPNMRYSQTLSVRDIYGNPSLTSGNISVGINWDLANQQAQQGTVAWYRNLAHQAEGSPYGTNQTLYNDAKAFSLNYLASRSGGQWSKDYYAAQAAYQKSTPFWDPIQVSGPGVSSSQKYSMGSSAPAIISGKRIKVGSIRSAANMRNF